MFGIGPMEFLVIAVFAVVFIGPQKLPELMKQAAKFFVQARRYSNDIRGQFNDVMRAAEAELAREELAKLKRDLANVTNVTPMVPLGTMPPNTTSLPPASYPQSPAASSDLHARGSFHEPLHAMQEPQPMAASGVPNYHEMPTAHGGVSPEVTHAEPNTAANVSSLQEAGKTEPHSSARIEYLADSKPPKP